ncbi:hypothetical protein D9M73_192450 [compost metagenome]
MVFQRPWRRARGAGGRTRADPGSHRLFHHRRGRSQSRSLRLLLYLCCHRLCRRAPRNDLSGNRRHGTADGYTGKRAWTPVPAGRDSTMWRTSNPCRLPEAWLVDALCFTLGSHRLRKRIGDSDFYGAIA